MPPFGNVLNSQTNLNNHHTSLVCNVSCLKAYCPVARTEGQSGISLWLSASYHHIELREIVHLFGWEQVHALNTPRASNGTYQLPFLWVTHRSIVCPWFHWSRKTHWFPYLFVPDITWSLTPLSQASFPFLEKTFSEFPQLLCQFEVHFVPYLWVQVRVFQCPWSPRLRTIHSIIIPIWLSLDLVPLLMEIFNQPFCGRYLP